MILYGTILMNANSICQGTTIGQIISQLQDDNPIDDTNDIKDE